MTLPVGTRRGNVARSSFLALVVAVLSGCLPSSQRQNDRSLTPEDSASTHIAATVGVDSLDYLGETAVPDSLAMLLPTSMVWSAGDTTAGGYLVVSDTQRGMLYWIDAGGAFLRRARIDYGSDPLYPYVVGARGDSVVVLARGVDKLLWVRSDGSVLRELDVPSGASAAVATDSLLAVRVGGGMQADVRPAVQVLTEQGRVSRSHSLSGPPWRSSGFIRPWGRGVVGLSGYRPVVDFVADPFGAIAAADTIALAGFDSPQLYRSAQFMRGEVSEPPLLTSSAVALGDRLFVMNLRPDHVRIDVYDAAGALQRVLLSAGPWQPLPFVPVDIAATRSADGSIEFAILMQRQSGVFQSAGGALRRFRWKEGT